MPTYSFRCAACGGFDAVRPMALSDEPAPCPVCTAESPRALTLPGGLGSGQRRKERAGIGVERAASGYRRWRHASTCTCCV